MSTVTISTNRRRVYQRRFDHDEMRELRATGEWTLQALADRYGVSISRIAQLLNPKLKAAVERRSAENFKAICDDCGGPCTHNWSSKHQRHDRVVCKPCSGIRRREETLLERLNDDRDIHCRKCGEHKPITMFRLDRGYPHFQCRTCETATRKAYRAAHRDQDRQWHADRYHRKKHDPEWMERKRETQRQYRQRRNQAGAA